MRRTYALVAIAGAAILGCAAFVALLPWGDPCSLTTPPGEAGCAVILAPAQENLRNASFLVICLIVGFAAGFLTRSHRLFAGALSPLLAVLLAHFVVHWVYGIESPRYFLWTRFTILIDIGLVAAMAISGLVGAALSRYVRLTNAWSGP